MEKNIFGREIYPSPLCKAFVSYNEENKAYYYFQNNPWENRVLVENINGSICDCGSSFLWGLHILQLGISPNHRF